MQVLRIEPDCIIKLDDGEMTQARRLDQSSYGNASRRALASTDGVQIDAPSWGIDRIDSRSGTDGVYTHGSALGSGTRVYVLDTGVLISHNDFGGRAVAGMSSGCGPKGCDGRDCQPSTGSGCWQFEGVITDPACHNHGTHCASTVGGRMYGVAKGATLVAVQVPS